MLALDSALLPQRWTIGLSSWVLQDGNYTEFVVGQRRQFALEFHYHRTQRLVQVDEPGGRRCRYTGRVTDYDATARLLMVAGPSRGRPFVLDFGLLAYSSWIVLDDLEPPQAGSWLSGTIGLSVDPFDYTAGRFRKSDPPPMIYTWSIDGIEKATTPLITVEFGHPLYVGPDEGPNRVADPDRESWQPVEATPIWDDAFYRLHCTLESTDATDNMLASGSRAPYGPLSSR